jgi:hypothetical protein
MAGSETESGEVAPESSARAAGLRYVSDREPGFARRRRGRGFQYTDLMRRETGKATSTIATMQVVVSQVRRGRIPQNYTTVMTRQSLADLTSVVADLRQVTALARIWPAASAGSNAC